MYTVHALRHRGYKIVGRNLRYPPGEIDVVAEQSGELVFVEVKTRRSGSEYSLPEDAITDAKMEHLESAIDAYFDAGAARLPYRIEVVVVEVDPNGRVSRFEVLKDVGLR
jgi:putative endonuclease